MPFFTYEPINPPWPLLDTFWLAPSVGNPATPNVAAEPRDKWYERQELVLQASDPLPVTAGEFIYVTNPVPISWNPAAQDWGIVTHLAITRGKRQGGFTAAVGAIEIADNGELIEQSDQLVLPRGALQVRVKRDTIDTALGNYTMFSDGSAIATPSIFRNFFRDEEATEVITPEGNRFRLLVAPGIGLAAAKGRPLVGRR